MVNVKGLYTVLHNILGESAFDNRTSVIIIVDFYDKVTEICIDQESKSEIECIVDIHEDFCVSRKLELNNYVTTRDNAKEMMIAVCPKLDNMIHKYELIGNDAGQQVKHHKDYMIVDL